VAGNGDTLAVAYQEASDGAVVLQLLDNGGGPLGNPFVIATPGDAGVGGLALLAVAGASNELVAGAAKAYVVLWTDGTQTWATSVPVSVGVPPSLSSNTTIVSADPQNVPQSAHGVYDGAGSGFVMQYAAGTSYGYLAASLKNPFELRDIAFGGSGPFIAGGTGGRVGLSYSQNGTYYARQAGFCSLSPSQLAPASNDAGAAACCESGTDCCSQSCVNGYCQ